MAGVAAVNPATMTFLIVVTAAFLVVPPAGTAIVALALGFYELARWNGVAACIAALVAIVVYWLVLVRRRGWHD